MGLDGETFENLKPPIEWEIKSMQSKSYVKSLQEVYVNRKYGGLWVRVYNVPEETIKEMGDSAHKLMVDDQIAKGQFPVKLGEKEQKPNHNLYSPSPYQIQPHHHDASDSEVLDSETP